MEEVVPEPPMIVKVADRSDDDPDEIENDQPDSNQNQDGCCRSSGTPADREGRQMPWRLGAGRSHRLATGYIVFHYGVNDFKAILPADLLAWQGEKSPPPAKFQP